MTYARFLPEDEEEYHKSPKYCVLNGYVCVSSICVLAYIAPINLGDR